MTSVSEDNPDSAPLDLEAAQAVAREIADHGRLAPLLPEEVEQREFESALREIERQDREERRAQERQQREAARAAAEAARRAQEARRVQEQRRAEQIVRDREKAAAEALALHQKQIGTLSQEWTAFKGEVRQAQQGAAVEQHWKSIDQSFQTLRALDPPLSRTQAMMRRYVKSWGLNPDEAYDPAAEALAEQLNLEARINAVEDK